MVGRIATPEPTRSERNDCWTFVMRLEWLRKKPRAFVVIEVLRREESRFIVHLAYNRLFAQPFRANFFRRTKTRARTEVEHEHAITGEHTQSLSTFITPTRISSPISSSPAAAVSLTATLSWKAFCTASVIIARNSSTVTGIATAAFFSGVASLGSMFVCCGDGAGVLTRVLTN